MTFVILVHPPVHGPVQEVQTSQQDHWTHHQTLQGSTIALEKKLLACIETIQPADTARIEKLTRMCCEL